MAQASPVSGGAHPSCPPIMIHLAGHACAETSTIIEKVDLNQQETLISHSHGELQTFAGIDAHDNASALNRTRHFGMKPKDCIILNQRYEIEYGIIGGCRPVRVSLRTAGEISVSYPFLPPIELGRCGHSAPGKPEPGKVVLYRSKIFEGDAFENRSLGSLEATVIVTDCIDQHSCTLEIREP